MARQVVINLLPLGFRAHKNVGRRFCGNRRIERTDTDTCELGVAFFPTEDGRAAVLAEHSVHPRIGAEAFEEFGAFDDNQIFRGDRGVRGERRAIGLAATRTVAEHDRAEVSPHFIFHSPA